MTTEELNQALFEKVNDEMKHFSNWLLKQTPEEVLNHAYEYVTKFDIISDIECIELSDERARALLQSDTPLEDIYKAYDQLETSVMDIITDCIESRADAVIAMNSETAQIPVYPYSGDYAQEHGEVDQYRESNRLNIACKQAIQTAIASHHDGIRLDPEAAHSVVAQFGKARTSFILANTIQQKDYDGRFSPGNKAWARPIPILPDENTFGDNCRQRYVLSTHPGLVDTFVNVFRKEYCQEQQQVQKVKPSVRQKLQATQPQKNAPKFSAHFKQKER